MQAFKKYLAEDLRVMKRHLYYAISQNDRYTILLYKLVEIENHPVMQDFEKLVFRFFRKENRDGTPEVFKIVNVPPDGKVMYRQQYLLPIGTGNDIFVFKNKLYRNAQEFSEIRVQILSAKTRDTTISFEDWRAVRFEIDELYLMVESDLFAKEKRGAL